MATLLILLGFGVGMYFYNKKRTSELWQAVSILEKQPETREPQAQVDSELCDKIIETAKGMIGFAYGDRNTAGKTDCSGLISKAFSANGRSIPAWADGMYKTCQDFVSEGTARDTKCCLIFFIETNGTCTHVEMSLGDGTCIGAWKSGIGIHSWGWWVSDSRSVKYGNL